MFRAPERGTFFNSSRLGSLLGSSTIHRHLAYDDDRPRLRGFSSQPQLQYRRSHYTHSRSGTQLGTGAAVHNSRTQESYEGNLDTFTDCNATRVQRTSEDQTKVWIVTLSRTFEAHPANPTLTKALRGHPHDVLQNVIIMPDWSTEYRHASWYFCGSGNAKRHKRDARDRGWLARRSNGDHRNTVRPNAGQVTTNATKGLDRHFAATPDRKTHHQHGPAAELHNTSFRCPRNQKNTHPSIWSAAHPDNDAGTKATKRLGSHGVRFGGFLSQDPQLQGQLLRGRGVVLFYAEHIG